MPGALYTLVLLLPLRKEFAAPGNHEHRKDEWFSLSVCVLSPGPIADNVALAKHTIAQVLGEGMWRCQEDPLLSSAAGMHFLLLVAWPTQKECHRMPKEVHQLHHRFLLLTFSYHILKK